MCVFHGFSSNQTFTVCFWIERLAQSERTANETHTVRLKSLSILRKCMGTTDNENKIFHISATRRAHSLKRRPEHCQRRATWHFSSFIRAPFQLAILPARCESAVRSIDANFRISHFTSTKSEDFG